MIERLSLWISMIVMVVIMLMTAAEIFTRGVLHFSFEITDEVVSYLLVWLFFFSISACHANATFHHVELVQSRLTPRQRELSQLIFDIVNLCACLILLWYLVRFEFLSFQRGELANSLLATPLWIPQIAMPVGTAFLCVALVRTIWRRLNGLPVASHASPGEDS